jgi:CopG family nickel-responsive transcriptional regulator
MPVISISLNREILAETDRIQKELGFSGRSEVIRTALRALIANSKEKRALAGRLRAILLLLHHKNAENAVTAIKHEYEEITKSQSHHHLGEEKCLEIFVLDGDAEKIKEMERLFTTSRKMEYVALIII